MGVIVIKEDDQSRKATLILCEEAKVSCTHVLETNRRRVQACAINIHTSIPYPFEERGR